MRKILHNRNFLYRNFLYMISLLLCLHMNNSDQIIFNNKRLHNVTQIKYPVLSIYQKPFMLFFDLKNMIICQPHSLKDKTNNIRYLL